MNMYPKKGTGIGVLVLIRDEAPHTPSVTFKDLKKGNDETLNPKP